MNWWEEIALSVVIGVLKNVIKNPASRAHLADIVDEIASLAAEAQAALGQSQGA